MLTCCCWFYFFCPADDDIFFFWRCFFSAIPALKFAARPRRTDDSPPPTTTNAFQPFAGSPDHIPRRAYAAVIRDAADDVSDAALRRARILYSILSHRLSTDIRPLYSSIHHVL